MKMKQMPNTTWENFQELMNRTASRPSYEQLEDFLNENFEPAGSEYEKWVPSDWKKHPEFLYSINLLKSTGYVKHHQFNIQQLYALPTLYLCVLYLSENKQRLVSLTA